MTAEETTLIGKSYYQTLVKEQTENIIQRLGELLLDEQRNEVPELSALRFAQGEVYFQNKDYETAIFKWENVKGDLTQWARKNMGDAYFELGLYSTAEEIYKSVKTESNALTAEISLQLFALYIEENRLDLASIIIKKAVAANPDYPNVTGIARAFFEEHGDWKNAVELAIHESIRTESLQWFAALEKYVKQDVTAGIAPSEFADSLIKLYEIDQPQFEQLTGALWRSYQNQSEDFTWIKEMNELFQQIELNPEDTWISLPALFEHTYSNLIKGQYLIKELQPIIPALLMNWLKLTDRNHALMSSTAVLAWNENFPGTIHALLVNEAEQMLAAAKNNRDLLADSLDLYKSIVKWAESHDFDIDRRLLWTVDQLLDLKVDHVLVAGLKGTGKSTFINSILGEPILGEDTSSVIMIKDGEEPRITEIGGGGAYSITDFTQFTGLTTKRQVSNACMEVFLPNEFLKSNDLALIDTPPITMNTGNKQILTATKWADACLFVLDAEVPFGAEEAAAIEFLKKSAPKLPVHFLLNKVDKLYSEQESMLITEEIKERINFYYPNAMILNVSSHEKDSHKWAELGQFISGAIGMEDLKQARANQLVVLIRNLLTMLLEKRLEKENGLMEAIEWNEEMQARLTGAINQVSDLEKEKVDRITKQYHRIKEEARNHISGKIPEIMQNCSELITEESDFKNIHLELNDVMNERVQRYIENTILPGFSADFKEWVAYASKEFTESQAFLNEMSEGFNASYQEEKIKLPCDFRILDDWRRDGDRMTSSIRLENVNILLRRTPSQIWLKGAGKLLGRMASNKEMLNKKYRNFIENEDYLDVSEMITNKFMMQFELFDKSMERDIKMFFREPFQMLEAAAAETQVSIAEDEETLDNMKKYPEMHHDPITLFTIKLSQYERLARK